MAQETHVLKNSTHPHLNLSFSENTLCQSQNEMTTIGVPSMEDLCIHEVFAQRVRESPDSEAVCSWDQQFSYSTLDTLSSRLAVQLVLLNVGPEVLVPLCFEKSAWTIVAMMAVLKAGGAFVPLDASYPVKRLEQIIRQTGANLILTSPQYTSLCMPLVQTVLPVSSSTFDGLAVLCNTVSSSPQPSSAAYVIFTSGSTGQPKGVVVEHQAFCACAIAHGPAHRIESTSRVLQFASYSFDASLVEILTTLMSGGCCCIPSEVDRVDDLSRAMRELRVDLAILTPTVAGLLAPKTIPLLKTLVMVGEAMQKSQIRDWADIPYLLCAYGPTEASVSATVNPRVTEAAGPSNIGVPVGCHIWITDPNDHNRLLPTGEIGEALIEGPNLARGYLNDSERTRTAFIENTTWQKPRQRFYKTGDLMRRNTDGTLEFFGRKDMQIKIRGQRVEIGEIEQCLTEEDGILQAAVVFPNSGPYTHRLVGLVCLETLSNKIVDTKDPRLLRRDETMKMQDHISRLMSRAEVSLPSFMVPAAILLVEAIPLLLSGKVNRHKITEWIERLDDAAFFDIEKRRDGRDGLTARTTLELNISQIWADVLNIPSDQMLLDKSFLSYGGDSISAIQVVSKCRAKGIKISVQDILKSKTIARLLPQVSVSVNFAPIQDESVEKPFSLSPIQKMFFDVSPDGHNHFNQSFLLRSKRVLEPGEMQRKLEAVVKRHSMLRSRFSADERGSWTQRITTDISGSYRFQHHKVLSFDAILPILDLRQESLDILNGPIFICDLFYANHDCFVSLIAHHAVVDLVSWRIIFSDLEQSLASGDDLPNVPMSFQNWCILQTEYSQEHLAPRVAYPLAVEPPDLEFWEMGNQPNLHQDTSEVVFGIDEGLTTALLKGDDYHKALRTEPMDLFLSALLYSFQGAFPERTTPSIHVEGHGREVWDSNIDISQTVGWFTTLYPLHVPIGDNDTVIDVVRFTKDLRRAVPHNGWGYFSSRYLNLEGMKALSIDGPMELVFNYSGLYQQLERSDGLLEQVGSSMQESVAKSMSRFSLFEVNASVVQGCLHFSFKFNHHMAHQERIQKWIRSTKECLKDLAGKIRQLPVQYTLSDFPKARLTYGSLDKLAGTLSSLPGMTLNVEIEDLYPCAPMQQGILTSQAKDAASYNTHTMWEVEPNPRSQGVDIQRLEHAWRQVVYRHPCLRTIFVENLTADEPFHQVVLKNVEVKVLRQQWDSKLLEGHLPWAELSDQAPLPFQFTIYEAEKGRVFSSLKISHSVMDGLSIDNIVRDILLAYDNNLLPAPASSYGDYISLLRDQTDIKSLRFWEVRLADLGPCFFPRLEANLELKREVQNIRSIIPPDQTKRLWEFCEKENFTMSTLFQLAWAMVLQSYIGTDDVCFGYLVSGRDVLLSGVEDLVGAFANMLICRADLSKMGSVSSALESMQADALESLEHEFCSLGEVHNAIGVPVLFNTIMSYQRHEISKVAVRSSIEFEKMGEYDPSEYDLAVGIHVFDGRIFVKMDFQSELLSRGHAECIVDTLKTILSSIVNDTSQDIKTINRVSSKGRDVMLSFMTPELEMSTDCIHPAIRQRVVECPKTTAIEAWDVCFSYAELYRTSSLVAQNLLDIGVSSGTVVPLLFEKSGWTTVAMLAVMIAGSTFVLLDPSYPRARLEEIIAQVSPSIIVSSRQQTQLALSFVKTVCAVDSDLIGRQQRSKNISTMDSSRSTDVAFIIFTSGSTGKPKGVVIEHGAFVSAARAHSKPLKITKISRVLQFASYSFDACLLETLTTLISGGTVCVPTETDRSSNLPKTMRDLKVTWANLTPLVADILLNEYLPCLQTLVVAGEAMSRDQICAWADSSTHLINGYGPTEASVAATLNLDAINSVPSNIGHPVGCRVWILDSRRNLVPLGALGQLYINGPTLARGYFGDPEKTAAAFIEPPSWLETNYSHIYKTGDLVRYNLDGSVSFVRREDTSQVKIRGQRVEISEIEGCIRSHLLDHGQVVVEFGKSPTGHGQLIAFIVLPSQSSHGTILEMNEKTRYQFGKIHQSLMLSLPRYMVPNMYIPLAKIPLKLSGKLDRGYLRELVNGLSQPQRSLYSLADALPPDVGPQTETEKKLQKLWCAVLGIDSQLVRPQSNFFKIGGDSVLAMKLTANAHNEGLFLTVSAVFQDPTLQGMAAYLDSHALMDTMPVLNIKPFTLLRGIRGSTEEICASVASQCELSPDMIHDIYPCTPLQEGLIALSMKQPGSYVAKYVLPLPSGLDVERFKVAWEKVVDSTEIFRTRIVVYDLFLLQVVAEQKIHWKHSQIQDIPKNTVRNVKPIQLGMPLQHFEIMEGLEESFFCLTAHHAVYDGWSLFLMFKQVEELYGGHLGQPLVPYNRFIAHLTEENGNSNEYWRKQFLDASLHQFPDATPNGYTCFGHESITRKLNHLEVNETGLTPSTILRAAWAITLARITVSDDVLFGAVLSGRNIPIAEATRIVGPTVTTVPIRVKLDSSQPIFDFLQEMQKHATEMIPHEHTGLQTIRSYSKCEDASAFTSVIIVQSKDTDIGSIEFMGSKIVSVVNVDFDSYPLVLEYMPGVGDENVLCARYDSHIIPLEKLEAVLEDFQFVLQQISGRTDTKIGDLMVSGPKQAEQYPTRSSTDTQKLKGELERIWKESRPQNHFPLYKPLDFGSFTESEKELRELWSRLLGIPMTRIRLEDNFFRLGGDSIVAIKLTAAARGRNINLPVATIFNNPTLSEMAKEMETPNGDWGIVTPFAMIESSETDVLESVALQCGISAAQIEDLYPCTPLQEGLMALSTKQHGAYVAQHIFRAPRSIDFDRFKKAWESTSQLHSILRTRIVLQGSAMLQVVVKDVAKFESHSTVDLDGFLRENTLQTRFGAPLSRFIIVQTAEGSQYFVLLLHHVTFDAWSLPTLLDDVTRFYEGRMVSKPTPYNNFINYILNNNKESSTSFWATYLKRLDTSHFPQLPSPGYTPTETKLIRRPILISRPNKSQITTSTQLRGAWAITLGNYSNCKDVAFCTTLSGRNVPLRGITEITGPTITTVPIRIDVNPKQSVGEFLQAIQSQATAMIPFEQYGLQNIRRISTDAMNACDAPSLLVIQAEAEDNINSSFLGMDSILTPIANISSYPLAIECKIENGRVDVFGYYDDSILSESQMHGILHHFEHVLRQLGGESLDLIGKLSKVSPYDYQILKKWNKEAPQVIEKCIHEITHDQATATPDAPAVWAWDVEWSHAELDRISSCLAYDLIQAGVKSEVIVPMCFERSGWVVVAMLGILKAGGAFLPWDPAHPEERRKEMIRQTGSEIIVASKQTAALCSGLAKTIFVVDHESFDERDVELEPHNDPHSAAYVIYTSGSTGKPKGVVIEHKSYSTSAMAHGPIHRIHSRSRVAQFASYSVDAICLEILTSIMMGGCTCICSDSRRNNGLGIALNEMGVTVAALTPSVLSLLSPEELPKLETVVMVGEPAPPALVERWGKYFHLINGYGPTESSLSAVMNGKMTAATGSNIGYAVGCLTWIADMDNHERLVPIGCVGELLIEGPTLARGYLHDEAKTSQAFIANPGWLQRRGSKLYKTGDLVRYDPDGTIVFIGRKDMQVKINGHRIELGEIEHHILQALPFVEQTAVETITTDDARVLVAILAIKDTQELGRQSSGVYTITPALKLRLETLEKLLIFTLPIYMVPNLWIPMNGIPIASSGKVDRKLLQEIATAIWNTQRTQYSLSDGIKREPMGLALELRKMWSTVLNLPAKEIGADDNFFRIGADSIVAMKLAGYASKQGWELSVASIYQTPILDDMANVLELRGQLLGNVPKPFSLLGDSNTDTLLKEIRSQILGPESAIEDVMPSTDFQTWAISYGLMNAGFITYMNLIPAKELDVDRLEEACRVAVASHPILRTTFVLYANDILQVVLKNPLLHFERVECVQSIDSTWHQWFQKQQQLQLGENIVKFVLLSHGTKQKLVMRISHAQYDGISFPSIWNTLSQAYAGQDVTANPPFSTFINAITNKRDARRYWKSLLTGSKMTSISSSLRVSYNRPLDQTINKIIDLPPVHPDFTLATLIKASWSILLSYIADKGDVVFGNLVSGRSLSLDGVVGPCLNIIPIRVRLNTSCTILELLRQIQDQHLASLPFETLGFRGIVKLTDWRPSMRYSSVVQHQNIPELKNKIMMDDVECEANAYRDAIDTSDVVILSMPLDGKLKIEIGYCEEVISQIQAKIWLESLCHLVAQLSHNLDAEVANIDLTHFDVVKQTESSDHSISIPTTATNSPRSTPDSSVASLQYLNNFELKIQSIWHGVLDKGQLDDTWSSLLPSTSFFSLPGADFVSACILASRLQQEGYDLTAREVIDNDTLEGQAMLIEQRERRDHQ